MEEDQEDFFFARAVAQDKINLMKRDKIDKAVLTLMTDEQLARYIPTYGDRIAVVCFCHQQRNTPNRETLLERTREKIGDRKMSKKNCHRPSELPGLSRKCNKNAEKAERKIEIGWLHFSKAQFTQVRTRHGGGTRYTTVHKGTTVEQVLETGKQQFFPNGLSTKGPQQNFDFEVRDFKRNCIPLEETVGRLYESTKLKLLRLHICSKDKFSEQSSLEDESDSSTEDAEAPHTGNLNAIASDAGASDSSTNIPSEGQEETDSIINVDDTPSEQSSDLDVDETSEQSSDLDVDETSEQSSDLDVEETSSRSIKDANAASESDTVEWCSDYEPAAEDEVTVQMGRSNVAQSRELRPNTPAHATPDSVQSSASSSGPIEGFRLTSVQSREIRSNTPAHASPDSVQSSAATSGAPGGFRRASTQSRELQPNTPVHASSDSIQSSAASSGAPGGFRRASIRRIKVVEDVLPVFMDSNIISVFLKMDFVNENAVENSGVSREVYTAFWEMFVQQCDGEDERVPRLRPDYCQSEWQAVGRVWVKGLLDLGVLPVILSKAFMLACIHGMDSVDADLLVMSFLNYLPPVERAAVGRAFEGTMEEDDEDDLLDLFSRMGSHSLPSKDNLRTAIESMAHKAILQEPKFVRDSFSTVMMAVRQNLPDKESVLSQYESKKATGKRVVQLLETTNAVLSRREQNVFSYLQRYVKNADQTKVEKFLRFCTGSNVLCVDRVMVSFNAESGLGRRPIGHTCGATLEIPCTYSSFPEFRTEFDNVLSSNYFEMDII